MIDLHDTLLGFRKQYRAGRAIAAPKIGVMKRLLYMHIDKPKVFINPMLDMMSKETMEVWDDCLCLCIVFLPSFFVLEVV